MVPRPGSNSVAKSARRSGVARGSNASGAGCCGAASPERVGVGGAAADVAFHVDHERLPFEAAGNVGGDDGATFCQDAGNGGLADSGSCAADEDALVVESIHEKTPVCGMDSCLVTDSARSSAINLLGIPLTGHQWCLFARNPERTSTDVS